MIKVWVLNWKKQIDDFNMSLDSIINEWVVSWLEVSASSVSSGKAFVSVTRTWSESFLLWVHLTADETVTLWNNKKIYLSIDQSKIDDWLLVNLDWSNVASIVVWDSWPVSWTYLKLAETDWSWNITDERIFVKLKWYKRKWLSINKILYVDENWDEVELWYDNTIDEWKAIVVSSTWLSLQSPSVNIVWLTEKISASSDDYFVLTDSENSFLNKKITKSNFSKTISPIWWNWSDWSLNISSWTSTISLTNDFVVKNYSSITISWSAILDITWVTWNNWGVAYIRCSWDFNMTWWTIRMNGQWWAWWTLPSRNWYWWKDMLWVVSTNPWIEQWAWWVWVPVKMLRYAWITQAYCWWWWWWNWAWSLWWRWGWILIIEVAWDFNFSWWTIQSNWNDWWTSIWGWWGWWGWWTILCFFNNLVSNTWTKQCNWWNWGKWWNGWYVETWGWWGGWFSSWGAWLANANWVNWTSNSYWTWWVWWAVWYKEWWGWWGWAWYYYFWQYYIY